MGPKKTSVKTPSAPESAQQMPATAMPAEHATFFNYAGVLQDLCTKASGLNAGRQLNRRWMDVAYSKENAKDGYRYADLLFIQEMVEDLERDEKFACPRCWLLRDRVMSWRLCEHSDALLIPDSVDELLKTLRAALWEDIASISLFVRGHYERHCADVASAESSMGLARVADSNDPVVLAQRAARLRLECETELARHDCKRDSTVERLAAIKGMQRGISDTFKARNVLDNFDAKRDESRGRTVPVAKKRETSPSSPMVLRRRKVVG